MQMQLSRHENSLNIINDYVTKLNEFNIIIDANNLANIDSIRRRWQLLVNQLAKWTDTLQV